MVETYSAGQQGYGKFSAKKLREMKKKALQSYKKIPSIEKKEEADYIKTAKAADHDLDEFIQKM